MTDKGLIHFDEARAALAKIRTVDEAKALRDKAEAARVYAKQAKYSQTVVNDCAEIKIWAERRAGELLAVMEKDKGGRPNKKTSRIVRQVSSLKDLGIGRDQSSRWQKIASIPEDKFKSHIESTKSEGGELTSASLLKMASGKPPVEIFSGEIEWYTPEKYIESVRIVLGTIDCDPASSEFAQQIVKANTYFTSETDGLNQPWKGSVFLNPPYSTALIKKFVSKLLEEIELGNTTEAILLTNNNTDTSWWHNAAEIATMICFTRGRISFYNQHGEFSSPTNGQTFIYFGAAISGFEQVFSKHGLVVEV